MLFRLYSFQVSKVILRAHATRAHPATAAFSRGGRNTKHTLTVAVIVSAFSTHIFNNEVRKHRKEKQKVLRHAPFCDERMLKSKYEDESFPANNTSIGRRAWFRTMRWARVNELQGPKLCLFRSGTVGSVYQGNLGDCWLLGAFACLADFPGHVESLFEEKTLQQSGKYHINLFRPGRGWQRVVIDDRIPVHNVDVFGLRLSPTFCRPLGGEIWPVLLEKAFAKVAGSYSLLHGGIPEIAFQLLTGQREQLTWERTGRFWTLSRFVDACWSGAQVIGRQGNKTGKTLNEHDFFLRLAYYEQANFLIAAAIHTRSVRWDGLVPEDRKSVV